jgi:hypothetical protein
MKKIGLFVGREWSMPPEFIKEVNNRDQGVVAELTSIGAESMDEPVPYDVLIDRISHEVPMYRSYLKKAVLDGKSVINNPFMWSADDKFFGAALITRLGIASPKTVVLPNKEYVPGIVPTESLRNLKYPLDWQALVDYIGLPCIIKDAHGGGWKQVHVCHSLQELIKFEHFVRCLCLGQEDILPMKYDPGNRKYVVDHAHLSEDMGRTIVEQSRTICRALGYDMNSIEWAIRDGVPYAIDFMNCAPDMDVYSLTPSYFEWAVKHLADVAIRLAKNPRQQSGDLGWARLFKASRGEVKRTSGPGPAVSRSV